MDADNIMEQAKAIDEKVKNGTLGQTEIMNGTLNDPYDNSSDRIVKVGNIADGTVETYKDKNTGETNNQTHPTPQVNDQVKNNIM